MRLISADFGLKRPVNHEYTVCLDTPSVSATVATDILAATHTLANCTPDSFWSAAAIVFTIAYE